MKTITTYLLRFALTATIFTIIFRHFLSDGIEKNSAITIALSAIFYGIAMFISGWYFGKKDEEYLPIFDVGLRFHLTTYIVHNLISLLWIGLGFGANNEKLNLSVIVAIFWGFFLFLHVIYYLLLRKNSINNLSKKDLFD